jgi:hypothetical protein
VASALQNHAHMHRHDRFVFDDQNFRHAGLHVVLLTRRPARFDDLVRGAAARS